MTFKGPFQPEPFREFISAPSLMKWRLSTSQKSCDTPAPLSTERSDVVQQWLPRPNCGLDLQQAWEYP